MLKKRVDLEGRLNVSDFVRPVGAGGELDLEPVEKGTGLIEEEVVDPILATHETLVGILAIEGGLGLDANSYQDLLNSKTYVVVNGMERTDLDLGFFPIYDGLKNGPRKLKLVADKYKIEIEYDSNGNYVMSFVASRKLKEADKKTSGRYLAAFAHSVYRLSKLIDKEIETPMLNEAIKNLSGDPRCMVHVVFGKDRFFAIMHDKPEVIYDIGPKFRHNSGEGYTPTVSDCTISMTKYYQAQRATGTEGKK